MKDRKILRIIGRAIKGDKEAFNRLMQVKSRDILYIAMSIMRDKHKSEELAQEVALSLQLGITRLKDPKNFDAWMYKIVYNACMSEKKKMMKEKANTELDYLIENSITEERDDFLPEEYATNAEKREELLAAIHRLPEDQSVCITLFYYKELSYNEIAEVLGTDTQKVTYNLWLAKKNLREQLLPQAQEEALKIKGGSFLAAAPLLSKVIAIDVKATITVSMVERFLSVATFGAVAGSTASTVAGTAATGTLVSAGGFGFISAALQKFSALGVAKSVVAGACAVAIVGGTAGLVSVGTQEMGQDATQPTQEITEQAPQQNAGSKKNEQAPAAQTPTPKEVADDTKFPEEEAAKLPEFTQPNDPDDGWNDFVETAKLYLVEQLTGIDNGKVFEYSLYTYDDPEAEKLLVTIERKDSAGNSVVAYSTAERGAALPSKYGIAAAFNAWI